VGRLQYSDKDLSAALVHVDAYLPSDPGRSYSFRPLVSTLQSNSAETGSPTGENGSSVNVLELTDSAFDITSGLRRRHVSPDNGVTGTDNADDPDLLADNVNRLSIDRQKPKSEENSNKLQDPLHWFGILVPTALRQSQAAFQRAVDLTCKIASLQAKVLDVRALYHSTLKAKGRLSSEAAAAAAGES